MESIMQLKPVRAMESHVPVLMPSPGQNSLVTQPYEVVESRPLQEVKEDKRGGFIEANTHAVTLAHLKYDTIVPVFAKDNEVTISHPSFIETIQKAACDYFQGESVQDPQVRVSHIIKGRTPDAIHKSVKELVDSEKTIYYERMAFTIEIPSVYEVVNGNRLNLTVGGVRAYNHENLYSKKSAERFKIFVGFKNLVCTNMCISTDGFKSEVRVTSTQELYKAMFKLLREYSPARQLYELQSLTDNYMTEHQFAQFIGKTRLYQCLPHQKRKMLPELLLTDTQMNLVAKSYYYDENFGVVGDSKQISMWNVYNLLTGSNKSSYIDNFLERNLNATNLASGMNRAISGDPEYSWFIN